MLGRLISKLLLFIGLASLCWGCVHTDGPPYEAEPYGLSKSHFATSQWELTQTITVAPEIYGDLFGLSTAPVLVEWDITERYLAAVERHEADSGTWAVGTVVAAYPILHVPRSADETELVHYSGADSTEPDQVVSRWWERTHMDVEWSDIVSFEEHFGSGLVDEHEVAANLPEEVFVQFHYAGELESNQPTQNDSFSGGDLVGIEFEELQDLWPADAYCQTYPEATGCGSLRIVIRTEYRRIN